MTTVTIAIIICPKVEPYNPPLNQYRDYLIKKAMLDGKLIIVMRMAKKGKKGWYDIDGLDLKGYPEGRCKAV